MLSQHDLYPDARFYGAARPSQQNFVKTIAIIAPVVRMASLPCAFRLALIASIIRIGLQLTLLSLALLDTLACRRFPIGLGGCARG